MIVSHLSRTAACRPLEATCTTDSIELPDPQQTMVHWANLSERVTASPGQREQRMVV